MFKEYIKRVNKKTFGSPIFYVTNQVDKATGIEELLLNYHIIASNESYVANILQERGINVALFKNEPDTSLNLLKNTEVQDYIVKYTRSNPYMMLFKTSKALEKAAEGIQILEAKPELASRIENKVSQYTLLKDGGFSENLPKAIISRTGNEAYEDIEKVLGSNFVAQLDKGHSGNGTHFIVDADSFTSFNDMYEDKKIPVKYTQMLAYEFLTINAVATKNGTFIGGLSNQITGLGEIDAKRGETCGNNWHQLGVSETIRTQAVVLTEKIGDFLYSLGFRGMFGIDFSLDNGKLYILEINARQTASIPTFSKIQIENEQIPLVLIHILEMLDIEFEIDRDIYNTINNVPFDASVLVVRNHFNQPIKIKESFNGLYNLEDVKKEEDGYSLMDIYSKSKIILLEKAEGSIIGEDEEYFKIIARGNIMKDLHLLDDNIYKIYKTATAKVQPID